MFRSAPPDPTHDADNLGGEDDASSPEDEKTVGGNGHRTADGSSPPGRRFGPDAAATKTAASTTIKVGAISTLTGAIAADFDAFVPGMQAYFDMVNARAGSTGARSYLAYNLDDGGNPSQFTQLTHTLIDQDHVFAVGHRPPYWFTPNYFVEPKTPTYGYNVSGNWSGPPTCSPPVVPSRTTGRAPPVRLPHQADQLEVGGLHQLRPGHHLVLRRLPHLRRRT